jgi:octaprenyl-diphosphate synthase
VVALLLHQKAAAKTASLISGACEVGALRGTPAERDAMRRFGEGLGMAFQIVDDVLDFTGDEADTGKPAGLDLREHKVTLPLIHALPKMSAPERALVEALMDAPEPTDGQIASVVGAVTARGGLEYARARAQQLCAQAEAALEALPTSSARDTLRASLTYVLERRR